MRKRKRPEVPSSLSRVERKFAAWRKKRTAGRRIPASLWDSATEVAMAHGVSRTALHLKLDYYSLKKRVENASTPGESPFIELPPVTLPAMSECVIEWEDIAGARMRVQLKGQSLPDLLALSRSFWDAE